MKKEFEKDFAYEWWRFQDQMKHYELQDAVDTLADIVKKIYEGKKVLKK